MTATPDIPDDTSTDPTTKGPNRVLALVLAVVAAAALVTASFSKRWLASPLAGTDLGFGLREFSDCGGGWLDAPKTCQVMSNSEVMAIAQSQDPAHASGVFVPTGWITFVGNLVAAAALLAAAAIAAARKRPALPISPASVALLALMVSLIVGCVFLATKPGGVTGVGVAWAFWVFAVGVVVGIAAAQLLAKLIRPPDPDLMADAMEADQF